MTPSDYLVIVQHLTAADGGGFAAYVPDLPGCISDGETPEEAQANVLGAIAEWIATAELAGMAVPLPTAQKAYA